MSPKRDNKSKQRRVSAGKVAKQAKNSARVSGKSSEQSKKLPAAAASSSALANLPSSLTDAGWQALLQPLFETDNWRQLINQLAARQASGEIIYPPVSCILRAFNLTPLDQVRVVILGQDPYHGPGQADGLAFSFSGGEKLPPTLKNLFKELAADIPGFVAPGSGSLEKWAKQGVLLLNTALTVAEGKPGSHATLGWASFTNGALKLLSANAKQPIVFLLWGKPAQSKAELLKQENSCGQSHVILTAAHPSPAACGAFNGCKHFSKANPSVPHAGIIPEFKARIIPAYMSGYHSGIIPA